MKLALLLYPFCRLRNLDLNKLLPFHEYSLNKFLVVECLIKW